MNVHAIIVNNLERDPSTLAHIRESFRSIKDCSATSIISYDSYLEFTEFLGPNSGFHHLMPTQRIEDEINWLIKEVESDFYIVLYAGYTAENITAKLAEYTKEKKLAMIKPSFGLNKLVVHSRTHLALDGFGGEVGGFQSIMEKINIHAINHGHEYLILESLDKLDEK